MGLIDDIYLRFGKYFGKPISNVPSSYLRWCLEQDWFEKKQGEEMVLYFEQELDWRDQMDQHFEDEEDIRY